MQDKLIRAVSRDGQVRAAAVTAAVLTQRAREIHGTSPVATAALGRLLCAGSMMGRALKGTGSSVTLRLQGGGPLGRLLAVGDTDGCVRGSVENPGLELPLRPDGKLDVGGAVGSGGTLTVIRDLSMKAPYVGTVALLGGEIAEDLAAYFTESEQIPTACGLGVLVGRDRSVLRAGGYLVQLLPGASEDTAAKLEQSVLRSGAVTGMLTEENDPAHLLRRVMADFDIEILDETQPLYRCQCSRERMAAALVSLGSRELRAMAAEGEPVELTCQFCDRRQTFSQGDILELLAEAEKKE